MKRNVIETVLGGVVLIGAIVFLVFSYTTANIKKDVTDGYNVTANFSTTGGLAKGDIVSISGVQVGSVQDVTLDPQSYNAKVIMGIRKDVKIPSDSSAAITSASLLGGHVLNIQPGAEDTVLENNGEIEFTQAPQSLEELLGKFIFSVTESKDDDEGASATTASAGNDPVPVSTPASTPVSTPDIEPEQAPATEEPQQPAPSAP